MPSGAGRSRVKRERPDHLSTTGRQREAHDAEAAKVPDVRSAEAPDRLREVRSWGYSFLLHVRQTWNRDGEDGEAASERDEAARSARSDRRAGARDAPLHDRHSAI